MEAPRGEVVLPDGRPVWTSSLLALFRELGVEEKALRQALMRTADDRCLTKRHPLKNLGHRLDKHMHPFPALQTADNPDERSVRSETEFNFK